MKKDVRGENPRLTRSVLGDSRTGLYQRAATITGS
jgi:hypothetical protein